MEKMKKCKSCGAEIAKSAKVCPHCGARNKGHTILIVVIVVIVLLAIIGSIGEPNDPQQVGTVGTDLEEDTSNENQEDELSVFHVGDIVELNGINVTLLGVEESGGSQFLAPTEGNVYVTFEFDIDNQSDSEITVSSLLSFEAYFDSYSTNLSIGAISNSDKSQLDGTVAAGKKMTGIVGYEVSSDWTTAEIRFTPDFWFGEDIIFEYSK